jgi:peroxiredoxin
VIINATNQHDSKIRTAHSSTVLRHIVAALAFCGAVAAAAETEQFSLSDTTGKTHNLAAYKGQWVLVNFWATWCPPCLEEIPEFAELYGARKNKGLMVIGIAVDFDDEKQVFEFAEKQGMNYPLVLGDGRVSAQFGKVNVLPTSFLFDPKGKRVLKRVGPLTRAEVEKLIGK